MSMKIAEVLAQVFTTKPKGKATEKDDPNGFGTDLDAQTAHHTCLEEAGRMLKRIEAGNSRRSNRKNELDGFEYGGREVVTDKKTGEIRYWIYLFKNKDEKVRSIIVSKKDGKFLVREGHGANAKVIEKAKGTLSRIQAGKAVCKAPEIRTPLHDMDPENPFGHSDFDESDFEGLKNMSTPFD